MTEQLNSPVQTLSIAIRLNGELARLAGRAHITTQLPDPSTIADLIDVLTIQEPTIAHQLHRAVPVIDGRHATTEQTLSTGQAVALLMPVAGG